jgi:hypothetical protein
MKASLETVPKPLILGARAPSGRDLGPEPDPPAVDERPHSTYEIVTRQMLQSLKEDVAEIKGRVNALLWLIAGALLVEIVTKLAS